MSRMVGPRFQVEAPRLPGYGFWLSCLIEHFMYSPKLSSPKLVHDTVAGELMAQALVFVCFCREIDNYMYVLREIYYLCIYVLK
ncbi:MAG TPA: hypothetical protein V6C97_16230 [Oculatellaceae cyanobacterium]